MNDEILKNRKVQFGIGIIILVILLLLLKGCDTFTTDILSVDDYKIKVEELIVEEQEVQEEWNELLNNTKFEDLCTEVYASKFEELGQEFIDIYHTFMNMKMDGKKETVIQNYKQYLVYFETYKEIGEQLQAFASTVRKGNYQEAIMVVDNLQVLNRAIPIIE